LIDLKKNSSCAIFHSICQPIKEAKTGEFMFLLCVYVPKTHLDSVKDALFDAGAGRIGNYDRCAWETEGQGQFRPLDGSKPYLGSQGDIEKVAEYKFEVVCADECIEKVVRALKATHPYEEPAYHALRVDYPR
jgi:hypothetical protein